MSGICGIVRLDGGPVAGDELDPLLAALQYRGPERSGRWHEDEVAFGHALLATTPEAAAEPMPLIHQPSGCAITADVRLDNREELIEALAADRCDIGDGELVLRAYLRWGEVCVDYLLGDFAFAIWDRRAQRLFAARDPIGMRQLCYAHSTGGAFVFATDPQAVVRHHLVPDTLYEPRIAQFLAGLETAEPARSFFEAVHRLEAAHCMTVRRNGQISIRRYWKPEPRPLLRLKSDEEYGEALLEQLTRASASRLRSVTPVGVMMSGGIDSTSVAAVAASLLAERGAGPLDTFSVIDSTNPDCVESRAIRDAAAIANLRPHWLEVATTLAPGEACLDPFDWVMSVPRAVFSAARYRGISVMLDGVGGDIALWTQGHLAALLRRGRLVVAWREARGEAIYWGHGWTAPRAYARALAWAFAPPVARLREKLADRRFRRALLRDGAIGTDFYKRISFPDLIKEARRREWAEWRLGIGELAAQLSAANVASGRERYDRVAAGFGVESRDPFLDRRLIDVCLALPPDQLQRGGLPKFVLRTALAGLVPEAVRWRQGKEHLGLRLNLRDQADLGEPLPRSLAPFVNRTRIDACDRADDRQWILRARLSALGRFLDRCDSRPVIATNRFSTLRLPRPLVHHISAKRAHTRPRYSKR